jgi:hypothetical protein
MTDREVVIDFTRGVMDRIRDAAELSKMPQVGVWRVEGKSWVFDGGHFIAKVTPVKFFHSGDRVYYRVSIPGEKAFAEFENFDMAQDAAESVVATFTRGVRLSVARERVWPEQEEESVEEQLEMEA